jgi:hypothetical protein
VAQPALQAKLGDVPLCHLSGKVPLCLDSRPAPIFPTQPPYLGQVAHRERKLLLFTFCPIRDADVIPSFRLVERTKTSYPPDSPWVKL